MPAIFTVSGVSTTLTSPIHDYKLKTDDDTCEIVCHIYATSQFTHAKRRRKKKKNKIIILELHWVRCWPALASLACNHRIYAITFSMILPHSHNAGGTRAHMHVSMLLEPYIWWWCHCIDCTRITTMPQRVFTHVRASTDANKRNSRYFYKKKNARRGNK